jgi:hypothetical protein
MAPGATPGATLSSRARALRSQAHRPRLPRLATTKGGPRHWGLFVSAHPLCKQLSKDAVDGTASAWNTTGTGSAMGTVNQFTADDRLTP